MALALILTLNTDRNPNQAAMLCGLLAHATPEQPAPPPWLAAGVLGRPNPKPKLDPKPKPEPYPDPNPDPNQVCSAGWPRTCWL